jgi:phage shock protein PspC (stress-responsive transcriptional regulator)
MSFETNYTVHEPNNGNGASSTVTPTRAILFRSPTDKVLGGVCGGVAEYLGWDPVLVRALWVVLTLMTSGAGLLAYLIFWLVLPVGSKATGQVRPAALSLNGDNAKRVAVLLIVLGVIWLLSNTGILPVMWHSLAGIMSVVFWPLVLIGAGYLLLKGINSNEWGSRFSGWWNRTRTQVNVNVPSADQVKSEAESLRQRIPLRRSRSDRMIMGVCGGIARKLGIDANLVRLVWAALSIGSVGAGILLYIVAAVVIPEEGAADVASTPAGFDEPQDVTIIDGTSTEV